MTGRQANKYQQMAILGVVSTVLLMIGMSLLHFPKKEANSQSEPGSDQTINQDQPEEAERTVENPLYIAWIRYQPETAFITRKSEELQRTTGEKVNPLKDLREQMSVSWRVDILKEVQPDYCVITTVMHLSPEKPLFLLASPRSTPPVDSKIERWVKVPPGQSAPGRVPNGMREEEETSFAMSGMTFQARCFTRSSIMYTPYHDKESLWISEDCPVPLRSVMSRRNYVGDNVHIPEGRQPLGSRIEELSEIVFPKKE